MRTRLVLAGVGLVFLVYGAVIAWREKSAYALLAIGAVFLVLGLVIPPDWQKLVLKLWSVSLEVDRERAQAAQETLAAVPPEAREQLLPAEDLPAALGWAGANEPPAPETATPPREPALERLAEYLLTRPAVPSHEPLEGGGVRLQLKRKAPVTDPDLAVACSVRKPNGDFLVGVPRLVGPAEPPMVFSWSRGGSWLTYEATFPDFFASDDENLPAGIYMAIWGTVAREGTRSHILGSDRFEWTP